eukprot:PhM_4_TR10594/c0_g2_i1/m.67584
MSTDALANLKSLCGLPTTDTSVNTYLGLYLKDKKNNVQRASTKLQRRMRFESQFCSLPVTDVMLRSLKSGKVNIIGWDYKERPVMLVTMRHHQASKETRFEEQKTFILVMEYLQTFYRNDVHECVIVVDRQGASLWGNTDLNFERDMATLLSKYYPQQTSEILMVNQHWSITSALKPFLSLPPPSMKGKIQCVGTSELWKHVNVDVLPPSLGGHNTMRDYAPEDFSDRVLRYWYALCERIRKKECVWVRPVAIEGGRTHVPLQAAAVPSAAAGHTDSSTDDDETATAPTSATHHHPIPAGRKPQQRHHDALYSAPAASGGDTDSDEGEGPEFNDALSDHGDEPASPIPPTARTLHLQPQQQPETTPAAAPLVNDPQSEELRRILRAFHEQSNILVNEVVHEYAASSELSTRYLIRNVQRSFGRIIQARDNAAVAHDCPFPFDGQSVAKEPIGGTDASSGTARCCAIS